MNKKLTVCQACLSKDRELYTIRKLQDILSHVHLTDLNLNYEGGVCWECKRIILKLSRFRKQIELAQSSLKQIKELQDLKSLSTLCTVAIYNCSNTPDPLNSDIDITKPIKQEVDDTIDNSDCVIEEKPALELDASSEESDINAVENSNCDYEEKLTLVSDVIEEINNIDNSDSVKPPLELEVIIEENEIKKEIVKKKVKKIKHKRNKSNEDLDYDTVKDKFIEVEFTEEEVMKSREEKKSHPNFKKLPYNCDSCVLGFTRKETYDVHMDKKHNESIGPHVCPICLVRFSQRMALSKHSQKHYRCYRCKLCAFDTSELWAALRHARARHAGDSEDCLHCRQCSHVAKSRDEMAVHTKTVHSYVCQECRKQFKEPATLRMHIRRVHGTVREHKCDACPRAFTSRGRLEAHMTSHGPAVAARLSYCTLCRVQFKNIYVYRNHLKQSANHSERKYHCEECSKRFASRSYYKRHLAFYHQRKSKFKCELCDRLFISAWRLLQHRQLRHGAARPRNHACDTCGKKFYTAAMLRSHQLTHSSQRSFMCADCGDTFKQRAALYTHTRLLHRL